MTVIMLCLCAVAFRLVAWPYLCGFFGEFYLDIIASWRTARFRWRTRKLRWWAWRNPKNTEPWTGAEQKVFADALWEALSPEPTCAHCHRPRRGTLSVCAYHAKPDA